MITICMRNRWVLLQVCIAVCMTQISILPFPMEYAKKHRAKFPSNFWLVFPSTTSKTTWTEEKTLNSIWMSQFSPVLQWIARFFSGSVWSSFQAYNDPLRGVMCGCMRTCYTMYRCYAVIESNANWTHFSDVDDGHPPIYYYLEWFYLLNTLTLTKYYVIVCILCDIVRDNDNNVARYDCVFNRIQMRKYAYIWKKKKIPLLGTSKWERCHTW